MKTSKCIGIVLFGSILLTFSCHKAPEVVETAPTLKVLKGEMTLPPTGGEDAFLISAEEAVQAVADFPSWCHVSVSGKERINVTADKYEGIESRYCGITVTSNGETCRLMVHQFGVQVQFDNTSAHLGNQTETITRHYTANAPLSFSSSVEWLHPASTEEGVLNVTVDENESKDYREGFVIYTCGEYKDSLSVVQFDPVDAGMLGDYNWTFLNLTTNRSMTMNVAFSLEDDEEATVEAGEPVPQQYYFTFTAGTSLDAKTPVRLEGFRLHIPLGKPIGIFISRKIEHTVVPLISTLTSVSYADATTSGVYTLQFEKNADGKWEARPVPSTVSGNFMFAAWEKPDLSGESSSTSIPMGDIVMVHK